MSDPVEFDRRVRAAAMAWLDARRTPDEPVIRRDELMNFMFEGARIGLVDQSRGIRKPRNLVAALSILTTFTPSQQKPPYEDRPGKDGLLRYKYRGKDPNQSDNVALRSAYELQVPLIWFYGVATGLYIPFYPVWLIADEPEMLQVVVAVDEAQRGLLSAGLESVVQRRYVERMTKHRVHQPVFRQRVIQAYEVSCAMCRLRHSGLLDAAHILPDRHPDGVPSVSNGLALCKIHHAAYDQNLIGVTPDFVVQVRSGILQEEDGPMLRHGIQDMHGTRLHIPRRRSDQPDREALEVRYAAFAQVA
ncbi:HNH endonuclease [Spirillospora sp. NPDC029432]|uniref:HNH endonuclease n=1 Tax=Spirillospora sp. NPDC029432 TaxID=3154599 RepID=UPI003451FD43